MKVIQRDFELEKLEFYKTHLRIVNAILPVNITNKELEIMAEFLILPKELTNGNMFNTLARREVIKRLGLNDGGMSNHIKNMKKKGYIVKQGEYYGIAPALLPDQEVQGYNLKLKIKV